MSNNNHQTNLKMTAEQRITAIGTSLASSFRIESLDITDNSAQHRNHTGHQGGGHYHVRIVTDDFISKSYLERHRMIYASLATLMGSQIHALEINAKTIAEAKNTKAGD